MNICELPDSIEPRRNRSSNMQFARIFYSVMFTGFAIGGVYRAVQTFRRHSCHVIQRHCRRSGQLRVEVLREQGSGYGVTVASSRHDFPTGNSHRGPLRGA